jgi:hypothetical protein
MTQFQSYAPPRSSKDRKSTRFSVTSGK